MNAQLEDRVLELEVKAAYQDRTIEALNEVVLELRQEIESLRREQDGWRVWRVEDGRLRARAVEVGDSDGRLREIVSGLERGDRVLRFPPPGDLEGQRVRILP